MKLPKPPSCFLLSCLLLSIAAAAYAQGGPPGGTVNDFHQPPGDPSHIYAATDAGLFHSTNGGGSWTDISGTLPRLPVTSVAGTEQQLFVGLDGAGVYRSRDGGDWEAVNTGLGLFEVLAVENDPNNPAILFVGTRTQGAFFSNNSGDGWIRPGTGLPVASYPDIRIAPNNSNRVFALAAGAGGGVLFESLDGGQTWTDRAAASAAFLSIRFDPKNPDIVYVGTSSGLVRRPGADQPFELVPALGALTVNDILVDPADSDVLYVASREAGLARSIDRGATWATGPSGLPRAVMLSFAAAGGSPTRLLVGMSGTGVFVSTDRGANWSFSSLGMNGADVLSMAVNPRNPQILYATVDGGGMFKSNDGGTTWAESRRGLTQFRPSTLAIDPADPNRLYVGSVNPFNTADGSLARSDDGGQFWTTAVAGTPIFSVKTHPTDGETVWIGTDIGFFGDETPLFRSRDRGQTFQSRISSDRIILGTNIRQIAIDPQNGDNVYVAGDNPFFGGSPVFRSDNDGGRFRVSDNGIFAALGALAVDPSDPRRVFVGTVAANAQGGVLNGSIFRSTNRAEDFSASGQGLPANELNAVNSFAFDRSGGAIYASTGVAVYKSVNGGDSWTRANTGLEGLAIRQLAADPQTAGKLYAATADTGIFFTVDGGVTWTPTGTNVVFISAQSIVGGADFTGGGVAPGEIVSIFGVAIGPAVGVSPPLDPATGKLPTLVAGVRVFFNDIPAPIFFLNSGQINCQVPYEVAGLTNVTVRIEINGLVSQRVVIAVVAAHPGIFRAALNQNFSVNSEANRAQVGEVVQMFVTGQGEVDPPVMTGLPGPGMEPFPRPKLRVEVRIGGRVAEVFFAGIAPGFVGLMQINVRIPPGTPPGAIEVVVTIGEATSATPGVIWVG